jgi:hypothetical protein
MEIGDRASDEDAEVGVEGYIKKRVQGILRGKMRENKGFRQKN